MSRSHPPEDAKLAACGPRDVTLYSRPGCHLCEEAKAAIAPLLREFGASLREVNIDEYSDLKESYGFDIPVIFIGHVALAPSHSIVNAHLADRTKRLVVKCRNAKRRAQFLIELSQILQMRGEGWYFQPLVRQQKLLVTRVPEPRELSLEHQRGRDGHLVAVVGAFAKLRSASVFLHAHHASRAAHRKAQRR